MRYDPNDPNSLPLGFKAENYEEYLNMCNTLWELYPVIKVMNLHSLDVPQGYCLDWDNLQRQYDECYEEWEAKAQKQLDEEKLGGKIEITKYEDFHGYPAFISDVIRGRWV